MARFVTIAEARAATGLRMACLRGVPSPWTEAAKGIFHVKGLDCQYAAQGEGDEDNAIAAWAGDSTIPVVAYANEPLRTGWAEVLLLAERLQPEPALVPSSAAPRAKLFGLAHEICGEMGFGWCLRLHMLKLGMDHGTGGSAGAGTGDEEGANPAQGGFPPQVTSMLAGKYGFNPTHVRIAKPRAIELMRLFDGELAGHRYMLGDTLTAVDIYWATFANLLNPLPENQLPAAPFIRAIYTSHDEELLQALTPRLREHQQTVYEHHLELPAPL